MQSFTDQKTLQHGQERLAQRKKIITRSFPAGIYLLKVNNRNTRAKYEICSKLTIKTP